MRATVQRGISAVTSSFRVAIASGLSFYLGTVTPAHADADAAKKLAEQPGVIFAHELVDVPGKNLVVSKIEFPPHAPQQVKAPGRYIGHRHPGSTYVYVIKGTMRLGIEGQPVQLIHTGESFFEPVGALHTIAESASDTEPATAIVVLIVPDGAPTRTLVEAPKPTEPPKK